MSEQDSKPPTSSLRVTLWYAAAHATAAAVHSLETYNNRHRRVTAVGHAAGVWDISPYVALRTRLARHATHDDITSCTPERRVLRPADSLIVIYCGFIVDHFGGKQVAKSGTSHSVAGNSRLIFNIITLKKRNKPMIPIRVFSSGLIIPP